MTAYYNEHDEFAAQWLRNLIAGNMIAPGDVDERSIEDVVPLELAKYAQCHFFAGIGVWSYAMRRAGWPDDRRAWSGSCPCQPFSTAGQGAGFADERHLWPAFFHLIEHCGPDVVFGEQVASKDGVAWLDLVQSDMEASNYAFGALVTPAAGFGAPHIRHRTFWMAHAEGERGRRDVGKLATQERNGICEVPGGGPWLAELRRDSANGGMAHADQYRHERGAFEAIFGAGWGQERNAAGRGGVSLAGGLAQHDGAGLQPWQRNDTTARHGNTASATGEHDRLGQPGPVNGFWQDVDWLRCRDDKWRPVEPGTFPLVNGAPNRVGLLRGYGNAIVAPQAEEFIRVALEYAP